MESFYIKYTPEITKELFYKLVQVLLNKGYVKGLTLGEKGWGYEAFKIWQYLRTNTIYTKLLVIDSCACSKEKTIWDFIEKPTTKEDEFKNDFKPGDWVWNSEDGVLQVKEVNVKSLSFSAIGKRNETPYYTLLKVGIPYSRHATPSEIALAEEEIKEEHKKAILETAERLYPAGVVFCNTNVIPSVSYTNVSAGEFKWDVLFEDCLLLRAQNGVFYTIYKKGNWANVVASESKKEESLIKEKPNPFKHIDEAFPVGCYFISPQNGEVFQRKSGAPWKGLGEDVLVTTMSGVGQYVLYNHKYATKGLPEHVGERRGALFPMISVTTKNFICPLPTEVKINKKSSKKRQLL